MDVPEDNHRMEESIDDDDTGEYPAPDPVHSDSADYAMDGVEESGQEEIEDEDDDIDVEVVGRRQPAGRNNRSNRGERAPPLPKDIEKDTKSTPVAFRARVTNPNAVDIEKLTGLYSSNAFINRLTTIIESCPPLAKEAFIALSTHLVDNTRNVISYNKLYEKLGGQAFAKDGDIPKKKEQWIETTTSQNSSRQDSLLADLKRQKDEGVKESTRRAMEDLFAHYNETGQMMESLKLYNRGMREYCTQTKHIITMYLSWVETAVNVGEWHRVDPLISQTERALGDAEESEKASASTQNRMGRVQKEQTESITRSNLITIANGKAKADTVVGISAIHSKKYSNACERFLKVDADFMDGPWLVSLVDVARYGSLTAMATLQRSAIKAKCLDSSFRKVLESEPMLVEALTAFTRSQFGRCFDLIESIRDALLLDPFFAAHVGPIFSMIRKRALSQYLQPFASADLRQMAAVFRTDLDKLTNELIELLDAGEMDARIDERAGTIEMVTRDTRVCTHRELVEVCDRLTNRAEWMTIRSIVLLTKYTVSSDEKAQGGGNNRGKRRGNDDGNAGPSKSKIEGSDAAPSSAFRMVRNVMNRMVGRNEADSPSDSGDPVEPDHMD